MLAIQHFFFFFWCTKTWNNRYIFKFVRVTSFSIRFVGNSFRIWWIFYLWSVVKCKTTVAITHVVFACAVDSVVCSHRWRFNAIAYVLIYLLADVVCSAPDILVYVRNCAHSSISFISVVLTSVVQISRPNCTIQLRPVFRPIFHPCTKNKNKYKLRFALLRFTAFEIFYKWLR